MKEDAKTQQPQISSSLPSDSNCSHVASVQTQPGDCESSAVLQDSKSDNDSNNMSNDQTNEVQEPSCFSENTSKTDFNIKV